jgi:DcaP outer membrane protein
MANVIGNRGALLVMLAILASGGAAASGGADTQSTGTPAQSTNAAAESTDAALKRALDEALRTIRELQNRVTALEQQQKAAAAPVAPAPAPAAEPVPAPVVAPDSAPEKGAPSADKAHLEVSGKVQLDSIFDFGRMNPEWNSTLRPSQIPVNCPGLPETNDPGCGRDGETIFSVRQTSLAFKSTIPTSMGVIKTEASFDLFGVGGGNTQIRLLNAWGELGRFGVGQYYTLFMNADIFPNTIDYWGPSGMVYIRNPQMRYTAFDSGGMKVAVSLEAPNSAIDTGKVTAVDPSLGLVGKTYWPDLVAKFSVDRDWGQFQIAGILREVGYQDAVSANGNPSGTKTGWGINVNGQFKTFDKDRIVGQIVYGRAIASYMNDGGVDLAPNYNLQAETVLSIGGMLYYDHYWNEQWSSSIGLSAHHQDNTGGQLDNAFRQGTYASTNILWYPVKNVMTGVEFLWGKLEQLDGATADDPRVQFSAQYKY